MDILYMVMPAYNEAENIEKVVRGWMAELESIVAAKEASEDSRLVAADEGSFVSDERQANLLRQADVHLAAALQTIEAGMGLDFISIDLRSAWEKLGEITGDTVGEDIIDEIFSKFCIGK